MDLLGLTGLTGLRLAFSVQHLRRADGPEPRFGLLDDPTGRDEVSQLDGEHGAHERGERDGAVVDLEAPQHSVRGRWTVTEPRVNAVARDGQGEPPEGGVLLRGALRGAAEVIQRDPQMGGVLLGFPDGQSPAAGRDGGPAGNAPGLNAKK